MIISSQHYLDDDIVNAKRAEKDYAVMVSPEFTVDGETYSVVLDGHHSLAAARIDGVDPEFVVASPSEADTVGLLEDGAVDDFLVVSWMDGDYYDVETGHDVW